MISRIAIVGRPNVGKSTLLNRLAKRRVSIVDDRPGVTRDRVSAEVEIMGRVIEIIDTGGLGITDEEQLDADIHHQIDTAIASADLILMLVDAKEGLQSLDEVVADRLRPLDKTCHLVVNKCEADREFDSIAEFWSLGLGTPWPISAAHGQGVNELIEQFVADIPESGEKSPTPALRISIVGRRNAGKSTFINALIGEERVIVSELAGTTRDAVDVRFEKDGIPFVVIDTAGMLRKSKLKGSIEFYAQSRALAAIGRSDVVILVIDAVHGISQLDMRIAREVVDRHRPCVIAVNKWDLAKDRTTMEDYEKYLAKTLPSISYSPVLFMTAKEGRNVTRCISLVQSLSKQANKRVSTGTLNRAVDEIRNGPRARVKHGKEPKIYYATQVAVMPPTVAMFVNKPDFFTPQIRRAMENKLRDLLEVPEVPVRIFYREKGKKDE
ncbi:MAG: ribosome biogenesis GTPase Der [Planctomycetota bacterium]|nr:ribosome biogenesis GTPase Der [Planctomycetota bacterium]